jgi:hypothetical protein
MVEGAVRDVFCTHQTEALRVDGADRERHDSHAMKLVRLAVMRALDGRENEQAFQDAVETAVGKVLDAMANGLVATPGDVSAERAEAVFAALEDRDLLISGDKVESPRAENEQLKVRLSEFVPVA